MLHRAVCNELEDVVSTPENDGWTTVEVAFTSTPEEAEETFQRISMLLSEAEVARELRRPAYRSRIAWENGTLSYLFEVSALELDQDKAVEVLMHHGMLDNPAHLVVA